MLDHALAYAERGWHVLPLAAGQKFPVCKNGVHDATTSETQVRRWWDGYEKDRNIGIACGEVSGICVLDVDPRNGGDETLARLTEEHGGLPRTIKADTGGGGVHFLFAYPVGGIRKGVVGAGLDLVSDGGYIVAPPSLHPSGNRYRWASTIGDDPPTLAPLPDWVREEMEGSGKHGDFSLPKLKRSIPNGMRNNHFIRVAGAMRRWGLSDEAIEAALQIHNQEVCDPPMTEREVSMIANSATRYEPEVNLGQEEQKEGHRISVESCPLDEGEAGAGQLPEHAGDGDGSRERGRCPSGTERPSGGQGLLRAGEEGQEAEPVEGDGRSGGGRWWE